MTRMEQVKTLLVLLLWNMANNAGSIENDPNIEW